MMLMMLLLMATFDRVIAKTNIEMPASATNNELTKLLVPQLGRHRSLLLVMVELVGMLLMLVLMLVSRTLTNRAWDAINQHGDDRDCEQVLCERLVLG